MTRSPRRFLTFAEIAEQAKLAPDQAHSWSIVYFRRHPDDDGAESVPGREYLAGCPKEVRSHFRNVLIAVAAAPPPSFAGGGYWEAMHGDMTGFHEVRKRTRGLHFRLFCLLDQGGAAPGRLVILGGLTKPDRTVFTDTDYAGIRALGVEYLAREPRSVL